MVGANPATSRPARKSTGPASSPGAGPYRSDSVPDSTVPTTLAASIVVNTHE